MDKVFGLFGSRKRVAQVVHDDVQILKDTQHRTPSPAGSIAPGPPQSPSPLGGSPAREQGDTSAAQAIEHYSPPLSRDDFNASSHTALLTRIKNIPSITLRDYVIQQLPGTNYEQFIALDSFFHTLAPPPTLHCVRCHKDYVEVENTDRSCLVPHDDKSTEVEHRGFNTRSGTSYQTLYRCCNNYVDGEGELGPPDGWCYEGKHTTDRKRARFRADSSPDDDMLVSCEKLRCNKKRDKVSGRENQRERQRVNYKVDDEEDDELVLDERVDHQDAMETDEEQKQQAKSRKGPKSKAKPKAPDSKSTQDSGEVTKKPRKGTNMHSRHGSNAVLKDVEGGDRQSSIPLSSSPEKPKGVLANMKPKTIPGPSSENGTSSPVLNGASLIQADDSKAAMSKPKKAKRSRKSGAANDGGKYVPPKDEEESSEPEEDEEKPKKRRRKAA